MSLILVAGDLEIKSSTIRYQTHKFHTTVRVMIKRHGFATKNMVNIVGKRKNIYKKR